MLIVRVRPSSKAASAEILGEYERAGLLRYALPLGVKARQRMPRLGRKGQVKHAVHAAAREHHPDREHTGSVIVHFTDKRHRDLAFAALRKHPLVESVSSVPARGVWGGRADAERGILEMLPVIRNWNHVAIRLDEARRLRKFREPRRISVAVLDSGVDVKHPDLRGRVKRYVTAYGKRHPLTISDRDIVGHGTHVSGIIGASRNDFGVDGICACDLRVFKVFQDEAEVVAADGARMFLVDPVRYRWALADCLHEGIEVINLSLGGADPPDPVEASLYKGLLKRGVAIVAAMGNASAERDVKSYPAAVPGVIAIAAIGPNDTEAPFSRRGKHVAICAPGVSIWSTLPTYPGQIGFLGQGRYQAPNAKPLRRNVRYDAWPGTSMATPHVTAAVALLLARRGRMRPEEVKARLMATADRVPGMKGKKFSKTYGAGRLNLERLLS
jgi:hypothetical protein